ncbi:DinB family protein [soil metagenome]
MTDSGLRLPAPDEYAPFYAGYIATAAEADVRMLLEQQVPALRMACEPLSEAGADYRYAPGKWSVKEVIGHLSDSERVFSYRALCIARGEHAALPGFDENDYVAAANFERRSTRDLLRELESARATTLTLSASVEPQAWTRRGIANQLEVSLRAIAYIIAGHMQHHLGTLGERYNLVIDPAGAG